MPWFRDELVGDDVVTSKRTFFIWKRIAQSSSNRNAALQGAAGIVMKLKKALAKVKTEQEGFMKQVRDLKKQEFNRLKEGRPYKLTRKEARERFAPYTDPPDPSWMNALHPLLLKEYGITSEDSSRQDSHSPSKGIPKTGRSGRAGYTIPGLENAALHLAADMGADSVIGFKSDDKKGSNQKDDIRTQVKKDNPRLDGEDDASYGKRISRLINDAKQNKATD